MNQPHHCPQLTDRDRECEARADPDTGSESLVAEVADLRLPIAILATVSGLFLLAAVVLARAARLHCRGGERAGSLAQLAARTGIEHDYKVYEEAEDCCGCGEEEEVTITEEIYISNSVLV